MATIDDLQTTIAELQTKTRQLEQQQSMTVAAVKAFLEGRLNGPSSATWLLAAISPDQPAPVPADFAIGA